MEPPRRIVNYAKTKITILSPDGKTIEAEIVYIEEISNRLPL